MVRPDLTLLTPYVPYPPQSGGNVHIMQLLRQLARFYDVHLYALADRPEAVAWGPLAQEYASVQAFPRSRPPPGFSALPAVRQEYSAPLIAALQERWRQAPPAVVQLEFTTMAQYAPLARQSGALVVCTAHNIAFLAQIRRARQEPDRVRRARRWLGALALWLYELRALRHCHLVVTLAEADTAALRRWLPGLPIHTMTSGVDLAAWPPCFDITIDGQVLFVGNYLHPPNVEGALWLAHEVWPWVRQARPDACLTLAGRAPPPAIQALAGDGIVVPGTVDDIRALYAQASMVAAPIFWGSGIRIKLLEACAAGVPVVTTAQAAEGIRLVHGQSALFAERPDRFAALIVQLLDSPALRAQIGAGGRSVIERDHDWERIGARLAALYAEVGQGR